MAVSKDDILEAIAKMSVMEVSELIKAMEEKFGVTAAAAVAVAPGAAAAGGAAAGAAEEQTEFTVVLKTSDPAKKIAAIKVVREITGLGLKDAKDMVEGSNVNVKENVPMEEAKKIKEQLEAAGCQIELK